MAFEDAEDFLWHIHFLFLHDNAAFDDIDRGVRFDQRNSGCDSFLCEHKEKFYYLQANILSQIYLFFDQILIFFPNYILHLFRFVLLLNNLLYNKIYSFQLLLYYN